MDNSEFLNFFWGLTNENTNEQIVKSAEAIINLVESKQKFENKGPIYNTEKYRLYLNICPHPAEDLLYTAKRLVNFFNVR